MKSYQLIIINVDSQWSNSIMPVQTAATCIVIYLEIITWYTWLVHSAGPDWENLILYTSFRKTTCTSNFLKAKTSSESTMNSLSNKFFQNNGTLRIDILWYIEYLEYPISKSFRRNDTLIQFNSIMIWSSSICEACISNEKITFKN